ncbi:MAG: radical SAM family heme chaperone HemW [Muribaculaceae bacterium]|nr:radical SAM family heme chaperone HemW [Muribaculaceae bacterium]MDE7111142.1 radical SAM family heme chaperone HemW [Muribaculaceae bacterium]
MAGLYVHIPFCRHKCAYCDFYSGPLRGFRAEEYVEALIAEHSVRRLADRYETIYIGGGTPSTIHPALLRPLLSLGPGERTVEVNPEDVTPQMATQWLQAGANRISMGVQSLIDSELEAVGRRHTAAGAIRAFRTLREAGFDNISLDLIYGLPGQTPQTWRRSVEDILELEPEHLSAYSLSYEPGTLLHTRLLTGKITETAEDDIVEMYEFLCTATHRAGFNHYEISNFAQPGRHSRHNSSYWDSTPYLGLGPGAHSFDGERRSFNPANLGEYMKNPAGAFQIEEETPTERHNDIVMTQLRTSRGLDPELLTPQERTKARRLLQPTPEGRLRISEADWLRSDPIMIELIR